MDNFQELVRSAVAPDLEEIKASLAKLLALQATQPVIAADALEYLTKKQTAKLANRSVSTVDNARRAGKLTPHRITGDKNGSIRFKKSEVIAWIETMN